MVMTDPYQVYALYLHPSGDEAILQADPEKRRYYTNKGFTFLAYVDAPGIQVPVARADDAPGGLMTQLKHIAGKPEPPVPSVPVGEDAGKPRGARELQADDPERQKREREVERHVRQTLKDKDVPDQVPGVEGSNHDRLVNLVLGKMVTPRTANFFDPAMGPIPGVIAATGVTRGIAGVDLTMPSLVPGISATDQTGQRDAVLRGEVEHEDVEVTGLPDTAEPVRVRLPRAATRRSRGVLAAPGDTSAQASVPAAPDPDRTASDQARHQQVREESMRAEGKEEQEGQGGSRRGRR